MKIARFALLLLAALLAGPAAAERYGFGVLSQRSTLLTAQYWNPILGWVERRSGVGLDLKLARSAPESNDAIERGEYDFVYSNTIFQPRMATAAYRVILRPRDAAVRGQIVALAKTPVRGLKDLAGREVGFPSLAAFLGYAVPMDQLLREGVEVTPVFGGNQEGIMAQLMDGRVAAAGVNGQVMRNFAERKGFEYRVLWESAPFNGLPVAVHPRVPAAAAEAVRAALAAMPESPEGAAILAESAQVIGQEPPFGFLPAGPEDYAAYMEFYRNTRVQNFK